MQWSISKAGDFQGQNAHGKGTMEKQAEIKKKKGIKLDTCVSDTIKTTNLELEVSAMQKLCGLVVY